jgi:methylmalonyl-CoA mutase
MAPVTKTRSAWGVEVEAGSESRVRVVTAAALYDGHDAAINLVRRLLVGAGAEVIHLGHNRSAAEIAAAAIQEDAHAVAVSSYQGGHNEFFPFLRRLLDDAGGSDILIFGGGGGVILPREVESLEAVGVEKIFTPEDGRRLGLQGMARRILERAERRGPRSLPPAEPASASRADLVARAISYLEAGGSLEGIPLAGEDGKMPVIGVTGTGGAGKSSLVDEIVLRLRRRFPSLPLAILAVDPTKRKGRGALLGDRLRMNAIYGPGIYLRSLATRGSGSELSPVLAGAIELLRRAGFGLALVETAGIGQGSSAVLEVADISLYVMTADFGGPTQLEKIDMLDFADLIAINKADRRGAEDAAREVGRCVSRSRGGEKPGIFSTCASRYSDAGVNRLLDALLERLHGLRSLPPCDGAGGRSPEASPEVQLSARDRVIPPNREHYLSAVAAAVRDYRRRAAAELEALRKWECLERARSLLETEGGDVNAAAIERLRAAAASARPAAARALALLEDWERTREEYSRELLVYDVRGVERRSALRRRTLSGLSIPKIALPRSEERSELLRFILEENLPGRFPFTAGVFPLKREEELPTRQFAGEGPPERTNRRFHLLTQGQPARRLSVAFDSVTLYGADPHERPDIFGKVGESGVSIATLDDMKKLFDGFDLTAPSTSVSMTINGPAPIILAMFFNAAIDGAVERFRRSRGREPDPDELAEVRAETLRQVRGTVQADILKEDQAQNTCIFSTEFALRLMGDVQEYFIAEGVRNFYSVSVSGYHIAEAGANPVTQLAFTLANGLTYVEYYKHRGMEVDAFAPNLSFFFSNGLDAEYGVLGRVARRIWAVVMRDLYGANERSQKLKYHIQTSGRSLHAREFTFNDIRTTLQALLAVFDHCNSLHTNAYDEAFTTPTAESVRRALAIQLIIQKELGLAQNENPLQGSFIIEELTRLVEDAVLEEFERISERGGVLGAMESGYLRSRIQEESLRYEELKHSGELEVVGVNTFLAEEGSEAMAPQVQAVRATREEKEAQIRNLRAFQARNAERVPAALARLEQVALEGGNVFRELMETVRFASLGQITQALFEVGGQYRRGV